MTDSQTTVPTNPDDVPLKTQLAVYGIGTFSTTTHFMLMVIVPIWARVNMGIPEGFTLGLVLGCRPLLSLFLSIHAGSLMDKLGTKRVMFFIGLMILFTPFMYPLLPFGHSGAGEGRVVLEPHLCPSVLLQTGTCHGVLPPKYEF